MNEKEIKEEIDKLKIDIIKKEYELDSLIEEYQKVNGIELIDNDEEQIKCLTPYNYRVL